MQRPGSKMQPLEAEDTKLRLKSLKTIALGGKKAESPGGSPGAGQPGQSPLSTHFAVKDHSLSLGKRQLQLAAA